eukprot:3692368-Heterocapsa_arctica.AAC.1
MKISAYFGTQELHGVAHVWVDVEIMMRGALIGRISRCQALGTSDFLCSFHILGRLREMHLLGYPLSMLDAPIANPRDT